VIRDVVECLGWWGKMVVWWRWWRWVSIEVVLPLARWWVLLLLLLAEDVNGILQFCQPPALPVDVLSLSLGTLDDCLSSHDGLLFLPKPLYHLLDPDKLILLSLGLIFFCFVLV
jgi:hypothetical protein